jgi:hypothetical protein
MAKQILLPNGLIATVDDEDYERVKGFRWIACRRGKHQILFYVNAVVSLHRLILGLAPDDKGVVDHIDGDGLNNCRSNLRVGTVAENSKNRRKIRPSKSGSQYKGVSFMKKTYKLRKPWRAQIFVDGKSLHLGYYATDREGAAAYNEAAREYYGEFAWLNDLG